MITMQPTRPSLRTLFSAALLLAAAPLSAQIVYSTNNAGVGQSWATAALWDNNAAASPGNNYHTNGYTMRTPETYNGSTSFPGLSLTVESGAGGATSANGRLLLKAGTTTINDLRIGVGSVINSNAGGSPSANQPATLTVGTLTILGTATSSNQAIIGSGGAGQHITVNVGTLTGSGFLQIGTSASNSSNANNWSITDASAFTGTLNLFRGVFNTLAALDLSNGTFLMAATNTSFVLGHSVSVSSFTFGSNAALTTGTYTSGDLNALFSTTAFSGAGELTVGAVPEPASFALLGAVGALAFASTRRRRR